MRVPPGEVRILDAPGDDPLGVDPDPRPLTLDRLRAASNLDATRLPRVGADQLVDHDRGPAGAAGILELLRRRQVHAADVDRLVLGVEAPADRHHVRSAVTSDRRDSPQPLRPTLAEVLELAFRKCAHRAAPAFVISLGWAARETTPRRMSLNSA